jgi:tetratricopeptide (TPR) repeat protein
MFDEDQIIGALDEKLKQNDLEKAALILFEYYTSKSPGNDKVFAYFAKMISRGYGKQVASLITIANSKTPLPQLLPILADAEDKSSNKRKAIEIYEQLIELLPNNYEYYYFAATLSEEINLFDKAEEYFKKVLSIKDDFAPAVFGLGKTLRKLNRFSDSLIYFNKYKTMEPDDANGYYNAGVIYDKLLNYHEAEANYRKAIELNPNLADAYWNLSLLLLRDGRYEEGWKEFEWRKKLNFFKKPKLQIKEWKNENVEDKSVLLYSEQGFGDTIQFLRFALTLKEKVKRLDAFVPIELKRLFESTNIFANVYSRIDEVNPTIYNYKMPFLSLPYLIGADKNQIPLMQPLFPFRARGTNKKESKNIGIVWRGNPEHENAENRDVPPSTILEMFSDGKNYNLFSFQIGQLSAEEVDLLNEYSVKNLATEISDFYDTALLLQDIDYLISVDTAIAHLAGSIGLNVFLLIPFNSDWRWGNVNNSPWYRSIKLFRQEKAGSWKNAIEQLSTELREDSRSSSEEDRDKLETAAASEFNNHRYDSALRLFMKIAALFPDERSFNNLGLSYQLTANPLKAEEFYRKAINFKKDYPLSYINLANLFISANNFERASEILQTGITNCGENFELLYNLALINHKWDKHETALEYYRKAYNVNFNADFILDYASLLYSIKQIDKAAELLEKHSNILFQHERYYLLLGNIERDKENYLNADNYYTKSLSIKNDYYEAYLNLASSLFLQRRISNSEKIYLKMVSLWPDIAEIYYNLGIIKQEQKMLDEGVKYFDKALSIENKPEYAYAKSEILLTKKDFVNGLPLYETRLEFLRTNANPKLPELWNEMRGKRILIFEEQGIGDTFQFIRFLLPLKKEAAYLQIAVREKLIEFISHQQIADDVTSLTNVSIERFDFVIPIVSLFYLWVTKHGFVPQHDSYLKPSDTFRNTASNKINIGIAWRGNPTPVYHRKRHMKLDLLIPLFEKENIDYYVLQNDLTDEEMEIVNAHRNLHFIPEIVNSWEKLSGLIYSCELIITIDTVYAHLAGALGKRVITMLPFSSDWRWGENDGTSYWYNNMKLVRQSKVDDWSNVIKEVLMNIDSFKPKAEE